MSLGRVEEQHRAGRSFAFLHHGEIGVADEVGHCLRLSSTPPVNKGPSARLGLNTRELLQELEYSPEEIERLMVSVCMEAK